MATLMSNRNSNQNISWIIAFILHILLLLFLFYYNINLLIDKPVEEFAGVSVIFGDDDAGLEDLTFGTPELSQEDKASPSYLSDNTVDKENIISDEKSDITISNKSEQKKVEKKPDTKTNIKVNNTNNKQSNNTNSPNTKNTTEEDLSKKKSQFGSLFGKGSGSGGQEGNQGSKDGEPNGKVLAGISTGTGRVGGGLSNRNIIQSPTVSESSQKTGIVVVKVCVDKNGKVIESSFTQKGSTTTDSHLVSISERAAKKYVFAPGELDSQCGTITFDYKLN